MEKKNTFTKALAIAGTVLTWFPIAAPVLLSLILFAAERRFLVDYLMPAELFLFVFFGAALLGWAAIRAHSRTKLIAWGFGIAIAMLFGGQAFAVVTGLASGEREPIGWMWGILIGSLVIYTLGIVLVGTGGVLLLRDLFKRQQPAA
jgi:hypothetical protein